MGKAWGSAGQQDRKAERIIRTAEHDVAATHELALDIYLRDCRPRTADNDDTRADSASDPCRNAAAKEGIGIGVKRDSRIFFDTVAQFLVFEAVVCSVKKGDECMVRKDTQKKRRVCF